MFTSEIYKYHRIFIILVIVVFQPELRRFLERLGSSGLFISPLHVETQNVAVVKHIVCAVEQLSKEHIGAIIVVEQATNLDEYISTGIFMIMILDMFAKLGNSKNV